MNIPFFDKFPVKALVLVKRGSTQTYYWDRARYRRVGIEEYYELKKRHGKFKPPKYDYMIPGERGPSMVILYEYSRGMYTPVETGNLEVILERDAKGHAVETEMEMEDGTLQKVPKVLRVVNLKAADEDMSQWASTFRLNQEAKYRKKSWFDKYGTFLMMCLAMVFMIVLVYLFTNAVSTTGKDMVGAMQNWLQHQSGTPPG
jgi:hypothetical protein